MHLDVTGTAASLAMDRLPKNLSRRACELKILVAAHRVLLLLLLLIMMDLQSLAIDVPVTSLD